MFLYHPLGKKCEIHTMKFGIAPLNPQYIHTISILYPYYGNIQLLWIIKIHSISNEGPCNFHSMAFYGFSKFFPVIIACCRHALMNCLQQKIKYMVITPDLLVTIDLILVELISIFGIIYLYIINCCKSVQSLLSRRNFVIFCLTNNDVIQLALMV